MRYSTHYYFTDGCIEVLLATFFYDGDKIWYEVKYNGQKIDSPHFDKIRLRESLDHIIRLPIIRSELRAKTMPFFFNQVRPNTLEHFHSLRHNSTYFKFSPVRKEDSRSGQNSICSVCLA